MNKVVTASAATAFFCVLAVAVGSGVMATAEADEICAQCICQVESFGCNPIGCNMDQGSLSCGYYQIKLPYYKDCGEPGMRAGDSVEEAWMRCADNFLCATTCVETYMKRYRHGCPIYEKNKCEGTARLHNGGPTGCAKSSTDDYWQRVKQCCHSA